MLWRRVPLLSDGIGEANDSDGPRIDVEPDGPDGADGNLMKDGGPRIGDFTSGLGSSLSWPAPEPAPILDVAVWSGVLNGSGSARIRLRLAAESG